MKLKLYFLIVLLIILLQLQVAAQSVGYTINNQLAPDEIVTVDSITGIVNKNLPFDQNFYLKLPTKSNEGIPNVTYFEVKGSDRNIKLEDGNQVDSVFKNKNELYILVPPLKPGKTYDFLLTRNVYGAALKELVNVNFFQLNRDIKALSEYKKLSKSLATKIGPSKVSTPIMPDFLQYDSEFNTTTRKLYLEYYKSLGLNIDPLDTATQVDNINAEKIFPIISLSLDSTDQASLSSILESVSRFTTNDLAKSDLKKMAEETQIVVNLLTMDDAIARLVLLGRLPINYERFQKANESNDLEGRIANLTLSKNKIELLLDYAAYINALPSGTNVSTSKLSKLRDFFETSQINLTNIVDSLKSYPKGNRILIQQWVSASTITKSFATRIEQIVVPDVGVAYFRPFHNSSGFTEVRPYYGVNIDLRPVNKDIRLRDLRKKDSILKENVLTPWHLLSIMIGVTVGGSIEQEGERDDLFGSSNLVVGFGVRAAHAIRFSTGAVLFNKLNANPLTSNKKIAAVPFVSISFDVKVQSLVSNFTGVFLK